MHSRWFSTSRLAGSEELKIRTLRRGRYLKVKEVVCNSHCVTLNDWIAVNNELEGARKEAVVA